VEIKQAANGGVMKQKWNFLQAKIRYEMKMIVIALRVFRELRHLSDDEDDRLNSD
jgi:hypothetical protein